MTFIYKENRIMDDIQKKGFIIMKTNILLLPVILVSILATTALQAKTNVAVNATANSKASFSNCVGVYYNGVCYGVSWLKAHQLSLKTATPAKVRAALKRDKMKNLRAARLNNVKK